MTVSLNYATPAVSPRRRWRGLIGWLLFVGVATLLFVWLKPDTPIPLSDFYERLIASQVSSVLVDGDSINGRFSSPITMNNTQVLRFRTELPAGAGGSWAFTQWLLENRHGAVIRAENSGSFLTNFVLPFIPWLLILGFIWFFVFRRLRRGAVQPGQPMPVVIMNREGQ